MYVGNGGDSWSSAVSGTYGVFLGFSTQHITPCDAYHRVHGFQLRCLSE
ncbi:hypothetical protein [uncultured Rikenella sp.]|nr:hypothetical protein [uncultured Rikenella sp.]